MIKVNLASKIAVLVSLSIAISISIITFLNNRELEIIYRESLRNQAVSIARTLEVSLSKDIFTKNISNIQVVVETIKENNPDIIYFRIYDLKEKDLATAGDPPGKSSQYFPYRSKISMPGTHKKLAGMRIVFSKSGLKKKIRENLVSSIQTALFIIAIGILLSLILSKKLTVPLEHLKTAAEKIAGGNLKQNVEITTGDEIGALSKTFNIMSENLHKSQAELKKKMDELSGLYDISQTINQSSFRKEILKLLTETLSTGFEVTRGGIYIRDEYNLQNSLLEVIGSYTADEKRYIQRMLIKFFKSKTDTGKPMVISGMLPDAPSSLKSGYLIPLATANRIIGLIFITDLINQKSIDEKFLEIACIVSSQVSAPLRIAYYMEAEKQKESSLVKPLLKRISREIKHAAASQVPLTLIKFQLLNYSNILKEKGSENFMKLISDINEYIRKLKKETDIILQTGLSEYILIASGQSKLETRKMCLGFDFSTIAPAAEVDIQMAVFPDDGETPQELLLKL